MGQGQYKFKTREPSFSFHFHRSSGFPKYEDDPNKESGLIKGLKVGRDRTRASL